MRLCLKSISNTLLVGTGWCHCVPSVLSILFQKPYEEIRTLIKERRERLNYRGILAWFKNDLEVEGVEWREVIAILRKYQSHVRSRSTYRKTVSKFAEERAKRKDVTYVVRVVEHCLIIRDGKLCDCFSNNLVPVRPTCWWDSIVLDYCVLKNKTS